MIIISKTTMAIMQVYFVLVGNNNRLSIFVERLSIYYLVPGTPAENGVFGINN